MIHVSRWAISVREAASCCHPLREHPGSNSSSSRGGGRAPWDREAQLGGSKLPTSTTRAASTTAERMGVAGSDSRASTIMFATPGWRSLTMDNESAQLAQCALLLVRTALRNPRPPILRGSEAASFASASHWSSPTLKMVHKHLHNPAS